MESGLKKLDWLLTFKTGLMMQSLLGDRSHEEVAVSEVALADMSL